MIIQHPTKSFLQDYWMSYMSEIQYQCQEPFYTITKISYINENTISYQEPFYRITRYHIMNVY